MATRRELPWDDIQSTVKRAIYDIAKTSRFVKVAYIAEHIHENNERYPQFKGCTYKTTACRVTASLNRLGWARFTNKGCRNTVFINPDVPV